MSKVSNQVSKSIQNSKPKNEYPNLLSAIQLVAHIEENFVPNFKKFRVPRYG